MLASRVKLIQIKGMADLTDIQWELIKPFVEWNQKRRPDGRGRPWRNARKVLNGVLWILRTGAPWQDLPPRYGPYQTVHRRFQNWVRSGVFDEVLIAVAKHLQEVGGLDLQECFVDGTFVPAKKGGSKSAKPSAAREPRSWVL